jgi:hypothetical protein
MVVVSHNMNPEMVCLFSYRSTEENDNSWFVSVTKHRYGTMSWDDLCNQSGISETPEAIIRWDSPVERKAEMLRLIDGGYSFLGYNRDTKRCDFIWDKQRFSFKMFGRMIERPANPRFNQRKIGNGYSEEVLYIDQLDWKWGWTSNQYMPSLGGGLDFLAHLMYGAIVIKEFRVKNTGNEMKLSKRMKSTGWGRLNHEDISLLAFLYTFGYRPGTLSTVRPADWMIALQNDEEKQVLIMRYWMSIRGLAAVPARCNRLLKTIWDHSAICGSICPKPETYVGKYINSIGRCDVMVELWHLVEATAYLELKLGVEHEKLRDKSPKNACEADFGVIRLLDAELLI